MTPDQYCQQKAAQSGSSFYYSFLFLPTEKRQAITALYAFCREVDDVVDNSSDPGIAKSQLQWWHIETEQLFKGKPTHPVTRALSTALQTFNLKQEYLQEIITGMEMDLQFNCYKSFDDLMLYCHRAAGVVGLLAAEIFGYQQTETLKFAENLGIAFQLTNIIRDIREDAQRDRVYLPADELDKFQVTTQDFLATKTSDSVHKLLEFQVQRAQEYYQRAISLLPDNDRYLQRSSLIMANIYQALLDEIVHDKYRVIEHRIKLTPLRKLWIAWKTARQEKKRYNHGSR